MLYAGFAGGVADLAAKTRLETGDDLRPRDNARAQILPPATR
jgi:hypothetical protein